MQKLLTFTAYAVAGHDSAHDFNHAMRVYWNAIEIVTAEKMTLCDEEIKIFPYVMIGHDWRDYKMKNVLPEDEIISFLTEELGDRLAGIALKMHANCSWSKRATSSQCEYDRVRKILQDADWIEGMSIERAEEYGRSIHPEYTEDQIRRRTCDHIVEKLIKIPAELNFESSRNIVRARGLEKKLTDYLGRN